MNRNFVKSRKYIVLALFLLITVLSLVCVRNVVINYNISDYLNEKTETKISLDIIADEFGAASDIQVMVDDITLEENEVIPGFSKTLWQMRKMRKGSKAIGMFYSGLGYGYSGSTNIPGYAPLIFEIEFVDKPEE